MKLRIKRKKSYISLVAFVFFFLFMSPVLSPSIKGITVYLYWFVPFFDKYFDEYLISIISNKIKGSQLAGVIGIFLLCFINMDIMLVIKIITILWSVVYLDYAYKNKLFNLMYLAMDINILIAILQFILCYINPYISYLIGPTNISNMIWGNYATVTNSNMYSIFAGGLVRVCGWSREAGFFAALLMITFVIYYLTEEEKKIVQYILFLIAFIISFSKMSILIIPVMLVVKLKKYINMFPTGILFVTWYTSLAIVMTFLINRLPGVFATESMYHRTVGYGLSFSLPIKETLTGFMDLTHLKQELLNNFSGVKMLTSNGYVNLCGLPYIVQKAGFTGLIFYFVFLENFRVKSSFFLIFVISTFDVDPFTATSFVVMAYWLMLKGGSAIVRNSKGDK